MDHKTTIYIIIVIYMISMIGIGLYAKTKIKNVEDYHLAGRRLGPVMLAGTLAATEIGGGSSVGVAAKAYGAWGLSAGWYVIATGLGIFLVSFIAPYMRRAMATTVPEIIGRRYGTGSYLITTCLSLLALVTLGAAQITATATIVHVLTGFNTQYAIIISGVVVVFYTWIGGMWSVTLTDFVQFFLIIFGFAIAVPVSLSMLDGGWSYVVESVPAEQFEMTRLGWKTILGLTVMYFMTFSTGQEAVQRYYSAKNERVAIGGSLLCSLFMAIYAFIPAVLGLIALAAFPDIDPNNALATVSVHLLPPLVSGLLLSAVISATLSSASGDLLGAASTWVKDIHEPYFQKKEVDTLKMSRWVVLVVGIFSILIALWSGEIISLLMFAFTLRATGPFAAYLFGLLWEGATPKAGLWSIITGSLAGLGWQLAGEPWGIMAIIAGSLVSVTFFVLVAWAERRAGVAPAPSAYPDGDER
ncbi:sodium:solute symporter family protein [Intestinirhabdus alba]|jgi:SSS family solute:Na+ symporter|uniref:Sodium:solute symporter family protein n=1 Tax=Intestinirhabdus alba TaxID=2899544 RepID=A0A6L6IMD9_9ENTR|nr:sodium:solute symporter family protein [Intestinirhabdus alba]MTH47047.1 sodium:solute symporter family protein [Intestinirhabdus alba]